MSNSYQHSRRDASKLDVSNIHFSSPDALLFTETAEQTAKVIASDRYKNKPTQIRKFYDDILKWQEKVGNDDAVFNQSLPMIRMTIAKVAYAKGRNHVDENFERLIRHCLSTEQLKDTESLKHCKLFLEAFMGFMKLHGKK